MQVQVASPHLHAIYDIASSMFASTRNVKVTKTKSMHNARPLTQLPETWLYILHNRFEAASYRLVVNLVSFCYLFVAKHCLLATKKLLVSKLAVNHFLLLLLLLTPLSSSRNTLASTLPVNRFQQTQLVVNLWSKGCSVLAAGPNLLSGSNPCISLTRINAQGPITPLATAALLSQALPC